MGKSAKAITKVADRGAVLSRRRNRKMAASAHAFMRGSTVKFYEWLHSATRSAVPEGPPVWICGDCHIGNLGPIADIGGEVEVEIRDLDQAVIGNPALDLVRLALSLATAARGSDLPGVTTAKMLEAMIVGYQDGLAGKHPDKAAERPECVRLVMRRAVSRTWKHLAKERIEDTRPTIPLGKRFWPLTAEERREVERIFSEEEARRLATVLRSRPNDVEIEVLDAAYWVKGCSSLGKLRIAVLLGIGPNPEKEEDGYCLIDIKEAVAPAAPVGDATAMPRDHGLRVVEGVRHLSPALGARIAPVRFLGKAAFMRELMPQDLKVEIEQISRDEAVKAAGYLAGVVGRAHARQMKRDVRRAWLRELKRNHLSSVDAPSWLWSSVVELMGVHEAAYLEHCRRYAAEPAR